MVFHLLSPFIYFNHHKQPSFSHTHTSRGKASACRASRRWAVTLKSTLGTKPPSACPGPGSCLWRLPIPELKLQTRRWKSWLRKPTAAEFHDKMKIITIQWYKTQAPFCDKVSLHGPSASSSIRPGSRRACFETTALTWGNHGHFKRKHDTTSDLHHQTQKEHWDI